MESVIRLTIFLFMATAGLAQTATSRITGHASRDQHLIGDTQTIIQTGEAAAGDLIRLENALVGRGRGVWGVLDDRERLQFATAF